MKEHGSILIADDEETFLEATTELLKEEGYECVSVRDADQLSRALKTSNYDLLITDLKMPGNRVLEVVEEIRGKSMSIPVIVVTGYPSVPSAVESVRLNVLEYLIKPIEHAKLMEAVKRGIQHKQVLFSIREARNKAENRLKQLTELEKTLGALTAQTPGPNVVEELTMDPTYKELSLQVESLSRIFERSMERHSLPPADSSIIVDYMKLRNAVFETIQVLQKTKGAFHSKDLGRLRRHLEDLLKETKVYPGQGEFPGNLN